MRKLAFCLLLVASVGLVACGSDDDKEPASAVDAGVDVAGEDAAIDAAGSDAVVEDADVDAEDGGEEADAGDSDAAPMADVASSADAMGGSD